MTDPGAQFAIVAGRILEDLWEAQPGYATISGVHDHDHRLADSSTEAAEAELRDVRTQLAALDALPLEDIALPDAVDGEILRTALTARVVALSQIREPEWNPMAHNPGGALHSLLSRDFAPLPARLRSLAGRLDAVPEYLESARDRLHGRIPHIHAETAITQMQGTLRLLDTEIPQAAQRSRDLGDVGAAAGLTVPLEQARAAVISQLDWLADVAHRADGVAHLGEQLFSAKLWLTLDTPIDPQTLLARAQADLARVTEQIVDEAGRVAGTAAPTAETVRDVLNRLADEAPDDGSILGMARAALLEATAFARDAGIVTVPEGIEGQIEVVEMPEINRGVAVAYCQAPGAMETAALPTLFAVSPTPADWPPDRVRSFYREYNAHMLHDLAIHEGVPGHALQLMHSRAYVGSTRVRQALWSGSFVEGWAVYAEQAMTEAGYRSARSGAAAAAIRMQQLKMQLRMILNAILDIRFHCGDLDEGEAMRLMTDVGFQEVGEAAGKWRRVQLTSTQLCTYYVGYAEIRDLVRDLRAERPHMSMREAHDAILSVGSPPPRHVRDALDMAP
jgi:uncharacterized protein (DUF885 family)